MNRLCLNTCGMSNWTCKKEIQILQSILPTDYLANKDENGLTVVDKIALVCCALSNVCNSVVPFE